MHVRVTHFVYCCIGGLQLDKQCVLLYFAVDVIALLYYRGTIQCQEFICTLKRSRVLKNTLCEVVYCQLFVIFCVLFLFL